MRRSRIIASLATLALGAGLVATQSAPASAIPANDVTEVATGFAGPLQFAINGKGRPFVAESFGPGTITRTNVISRNAVNSCQLIIRRCCLLR